jgi:2-oxoisovalerate dehydrogenase E1 component beta subunit
MIPIGPARHCRAGAQATVVSYGRTMPLVIEAAEKLAQQGIDYDVWDLRTIYPYDWDSISESIKRTGRVIFINEDTEIANFGEHLLRRTCDELFYHLKVRPRMLAGKHIPGVGICPTLEYASVPQGVHIEKEMAELAMEQA